MLQREADGAEAERRVRFVGAVADGQLVAAQIERSDDNWPVAHLPQDGRVRLEVFVLARKLLAVEVEELGAVQAHALAAVREHRRHFLRELDVRPQAHPAPVERHGGQVPLLEQRGLAELRFGAGSLEPHQVGGVG